MAQSEGKPLFYCRWFAPAATVAGAALLVACAASTPAPRPAPASAEVTSMPTSASTTAPASAPTEPKIDPDGELRSRRMKIWGEVKVILKGKHAPLPPLQRRATESTKPPFATVHNDTPHALTVWLAGPCAQKLEIPARSEASAELCAGRYTVAAKVATSAFMPLVREDQQFTPGVRYDLRIQIRRAPKTIRKRRWITP